MNDEAVVKLSVFNYTLKMHKFIVFFALLAVATAAIIPTGIVGPSGSIVEEHALPIVNHELPLVRSGLYPAAFSQFWDAGFKCAGGYCGYPYAYPYRYFL